MNLSQVEECTRYSPNIHLLFFISKNGYSGSVHSLTFHNYGWNVCPNTKLFWSEK